MSYYASSGDRIYLNIILKNILIMNPSYISDNIKNFFIDICPIASIKPLLYANTKFLSDQWQISLDITDREKITETIPRIIKLLDNKVTLS